MSDDELRIKNLRGLALATALREEAETVQRPDRAMLMVRAADEIESLIKELKEA